MLRSIILRGVVIPRLTRDPLPGYSAFNRGIAGQARNDKGGRRQGIAGQARNDKMMSARLLVYSFTRLLVYSFTRLLVNSFTYIK
jgi:hypothetical protein